MGALHVAGSLGQGPEPGYARLLRLIFLAESFPGFQGFPFPDRFEEPEPPSRLLRLYCTIVVERESQKPIVVGKGGDMIKKIGTAAREELERFFDLKVFLDLHVRVKAEWREDETVLSDIGLGHRHDS